MKVRELLAELSKADPELDVYLSSDAEGNQIRPVDGDDPFTPGRFTDDDGFWDEENCDGPVNAICLFPRHC